MEKTVIYNELKEALKYYYAYTMLDFTPEHYKTYLDELLEIDAVRAYLDGIKAKSTVEHQAVFEFLAGKSLEEILSRFYTRKAKLTLEMLNEWIYGSEEKLGLVPAMYEIFMKIQEHYCPFHSGKQGNSKSAMAPYPTHGNPPCRCREK